MHKIFRFVLLIMPLLLLFGCGGGGNTTDTIILPPDSPSTQQISGVVFNGVTTEYQIEIFDFDGVELGSVKTDGDGVYSAEVANVVPPNGYVILAKRIDETSDIYKAIYDIGDDTEGYNVTPITTLIAEFETSETQFSRIEQRTKTILKLNSLGLMGLTDWNAIASEFFSLSRINIRIQQLNGLANWIDTLKLDLDDNQLSPLEMNNGFPRAHGGLLAIKFVNENKLNVFRGQTLKRQLIAEWIESANEVNYSLVEAPDWIEINENVVDIHPPAGLNNGELYQFTVLATVNGNEVGRQAVLDIFILEEQVLLQGKLGIEGGMITNEFKDIAIEAQPDSLSQEYTIVYMGALDEKKRLITTLTVSPTILQEDIAALQLLIPKSDAVVNNYFSDASEKFAVGRMNVGETVSADCDTPWVDRNGDGFGFPYIWLAETRPYLDGREDFFEPPSSFSGGIPQLKTSKIFVSDSNIHYQCAYTLRSSVIKENSKDKVPVLFIHGFIPSGELGGFDDNLEYFGVFPKMIEEFPAQDYTSFLFQWRPNVRFQTAANDLGNAISQIKQQTGKKVHIVAHSFGGILIRALMQGLAEKYDADQGMFINNPRFEQTFIEDSIASLTTVGTPHSGIFGEDTNVTFNGIEILFPDGTSSFDGDNLIPFCRAISCHQVGNGVFLGFIDRDWKTELFEVKQNKGYVIHGLHTNEYPNIPTQILIGAIPTNSVVYDHNNSSLSYSNIKGDGLISIEGQRFNNLGYDSLYQTDVVKEHLLGFEKFEMDSFEISTTNYYMDNLRNDMPIIFPLNPEIYWFGEDGKNELRNRFNAGYTHSTKDYRRFSEPLYIAADHTIVALGRSSEVGLQECLEQDSPTEVDLDCKHQTWQYFRTFIEEQGVKDTLSHEEIVFKGRFIVDGNSETSVGTVGVNVYVEHELILSEVLGDTDDNSFTFGLEFFPLAEYEFHFIPQDDELRTTVVHKQVEAQLEEPRLISIPTVNLTTNSFATGDLLVDVTDLISGLSLDDFDVEVLNSSNVIVFSERFFSSGVVPDLPKGAYLVNIRKEGYAIETKTCFIVEYVSSQCLIELQHKGNIRDVSFSPSTDIEVGIPVYFYALTEGKVLKATIQYRDGGDEFDMEMDGTGNKWTHDRSFESAGSKNVIVRVYGQSEIASDIYEVSLTVNEPPEAPAITNVSYSPNTNIEVGETVNFTAAVSSSTSRVTIQYSTNGDEFDMDGAGTTWIHSWEFETSGDKNIKVRAYDQSGIERDRYDVSLTVEEPTEAPAITNVSYSPNINIEVGELVAFTASVSGLASRVTIQYSNNGDEFDMDGAGTVWTHSREFESSGSKSITVKAYDQSDIERDIFGVNLTVEEPTEAPDITNVSYNPSSNIEVGETVNFTATVSGSSSRVTIQYSSNGDEFDMDGAGTTWAHSREFETSGSKSITVRAYDLSDIERDTYDVSLTVEEPAEAPDITNVSYSPNINIEVGETVSFTATVSGLASRVTIQYSSNGSEFEMSGSGSRWTNDRVFESTGSKSITVRAYDQNNVERDTYNLSLTVEALPEITGVTYSPNSDINVGETVSFTATVSGSASRVTIQYSSNGSEFEMSGSSSRWTNDRIFESSGSKNITVRAYDQNNVRRDSYFVSLTVTH